MPLVVKDGITQMPEGYLWCRECCALTPHEENRGEQYCRVCDSYIIWDPVCPNCNWSAENDLEGPSEYEVKIHKLDCPAFQIERLNDVYEREGEYEKMKEVIDCDCEEVTIYPHPHIYDHWQHSLFSMDCINAVEWGSKIRCPICGTIFEWDTSNC